MRLLGKYMTLGYLDKYEKEHQSSLIPSAHVRTPNQHRKTTHTAPESKPYTLNPVGNAHQPQAGGNKRVPLKKLNQNCKLKSQLGRYGFQNVQLQSHVVYFPIKQVTSNSNFTRQKMTRMATKKMLLRSAPALPTLSQQIKAKACPAAALSLAFA